MFQNLLKTTALQYTGCFNNSPHFPPRVSEWKMGSPLKTMCLFSNTPHMVENAENCYDNSYTVIQQFPTDDTFCTILFPCMVKNVECG